MYRPLDMCNLRRVALPTGRTKIFMVAENASAQDRKYKSTSTQLNEVCVNLVKAYEFTIRRGGQTRAWISAISSQVNVIVLGYQE